MRMISCESTLLVKMTHALSPFIAHVPYACAHTYRVRLPQFVDASANPSSALTCRVGVEAHVVACRMAAEDYAEKLSTPITDDLHEQQVEYAKAVQEGKVRADDCLYGYISHNEHVGLCVYTQVEVVDTCVDLREICNYDGGEHGGHQPVAHVLFSPGHDAEGARLRGDAYAHYDLLIPFGDDEPSVVIVNVGAAPSEARPERAPDHDGDSIFSRCADRTC